jgi:hypothetical protein
MGAAAWNAHGAALLQDLEEQTGPAPSLSSWRNLPAPLLRTHWQVAAVMIVLEEGCDPYERLFQVGVEIPKMDRTAVYPRFHTSRNDWRERPYLNWSSWWSYRLHVEVLWRPEVVAHISSAGRLLADHAVSEDDAIAELRMFFLPHCKRLGIPPQHVPYRDIANLALYEELRERAIQTQWAKACREWVREEQINDGHDGQLSLF